MKLKFIFFFILLLSAGIFAANVNEFITCDNGVTLCLEKDIPAVKEGINKYLSLTESGVPGGGAITYKHLYGGNASQNIRMQAIDPNLRSQALYEEALGFIEIAKIKRNYESVQVIEIVETVAPLEFPKEEGLGNTNFGAMLTLGDVDYYYWDGSQWIAPENTRAGGVVYEDFEKYSEQGSLDSIWTIGKLISPYWSYSGRENSNQMYINLRCDFGLDPENHEFHSSTFDVTYNIDFNNLDEADATLLDMLSVMENGLKECDAKSLGLENIEQEPQAEISDAETDQNCLEFGEGLMTFYGEKTNVLGGPYDHYINAIAKEKGVDPSLIKTLMNLSSNFNPAYFSPTPSDASLKKKGLMAITPSEFSKYADGGHAKEVFDIESNIRAGTNKFISLVQENGGNGCWALDYWFDYEKAKKAKKEGISWASFDSDSTSKAMILHEKYQVQAEEDNVNELAVSSATGGKISATDKLLIIGDSHMVGDYGGKLYSLFSDTSSATVRMHGVVGTSPQHWISSTDSDAFKKNDWWRIKYEDGKEDKKTKTLPANYFDNIADDFVPTSIIVSLGTNMIYQQGTGNIELYVDQLASLAASKGTCYWVGPPHVGRGHEYADKINAANNEIKVAASQHCTFIDSLTLTDKNSIGSTAYHYPKTLAEEWATRVFQTIQGFGVDQLKPVSIGPAITEIPEGLDHLGAGDGWYISATPTPGNYETNILPYTFETLKPSSSVSKKGVVYGYFSSKHCVTGTENFSVGTEVTSKGNLRCKCDGVMGKPSKTQKEVVEAISTLIPEFSPSEAPTMEYGEVRITGYYVLDYGDFCGKLTPQECGEKKPSTWAKMYSDAKMQGTIFYDGDYYFYTALSKTGPTYTIDSTKATDGPMGIAGMVLPGISIAVNSNPASPGYIPYGSRVYLEFDNDPNNIANGWHVAGDTGGHFVCAPKIDIYHGVGKEARARAYAAGTKAKVWVFPPIQGDAPGAQTQLINSETGEAVASADEGGFWDWLQFWA